MDDKISNLKGFATMADGTRKSLTNEECQQIFNEIKSAKINRQTKMPTEQSAIEAMFEAYQRLIELGWGEASYCPKDGESFKAIEAGSTGIFDCVYSGEWPKGNYLITDHDDLYFSHPILFKKGPQMTDQTKLIEAIAHVEEIDNAIRTGDVMDVYRMQVPPNQDHDSDFMVKMVCDAARSTLSQPTGKGEVNGNYKY